MHKEQSQYWGFLGKCANIVIKLDIFNTEQGLIWQSDLHVLLAQQIKSDPVIIASDLNGSLWLSTMKHR